MYNWCKTFLPIVYLYLTINQQKNSYPHGVLTVFSYRLGMTTTLTLIGSKRFSCVWGETTTLTLNGSKCFLQIWSVNTAVTLIGSKCFESRETTTQSVDGVWNGTVAPPLVYLVTYRTFFNYQNEFPFLV